MLNATQFCPMWIDGNLVEVTPLLQPPGHHIQTLAEFKTNITSTSVVPAIVSASVSAADDSAGLANKTGRVIVSLVNDATTLQAYKLLEDAVLAPLINELTPFELLLQNGSDARPSIQMMVSRVGSVGLNVTLINNRGVTKQPNTAPVVDSSADMMVQLRLKVGSIVEAFSTRLPVTRLAVGRGGDSVTVSIPAGDVALVSVKISVTGSSRQKSDDDIPSVPAPTRRSTSLWVWPNRQHEYLVQKEQLDAWGRAGFLSELFIFAGHQILPQSLLANSSSGWPWALPGDAVTGMPWARAALDANVVQANGYKIGISPTVSGPLNVSDARAFLLNASAVEQFTKMALADALVHKYSGFNFDWELADACGPATCGQVTNADRNAMAAFLTGFAAALAPHGLAVSQDVGQAAFPANTNTSAVRGSHLRLFGMDTYTCNDTGPRAFGGFVSRGLAHLGVSNYGAALSSVNVTITAPNLDPTAQCIQGWIAPPPAEQLRRRFELLTDSGVQAISLLIGSPDPENVTGEFIPLMREFLVGGSFRQKSDDDTIKTIESPASTLQTWWHDDAEQQAVRPVAPSAVRQSSAFSANVTTASGSDYWERSFVYQSIPRSGAEKRGYTAVDGAEYAASSGLSMSWTTFVYSADVWVAVTHLGLGRSQRSAPPPNVTLRPRRVAVSLERRWLDGATLAIKIPHQPGGLRVSVEFDTELFDTFNDGTNCCQLTDKAGPGHTFVHRQPRHAMLIFAEPMLTAEEAPRLDPLHNAAVNGSSGDGSGGIAFAPQGDIAAFIQAATKPVLYFQPGVYYMGPSASAVLRNAVRWVHLAPGAFVKGAFTFWGSGEGVSEYKLTGFGVLSGEQYVWAADAAQNYTHTSGGYGQLKMLQLQCNADCAAMTMHGITVSEPPFYSTVIYGDGDPSQGLAVDVVRYKQVGAWYWMTNGMELGSQGAGAWGWGKVEDSFMHCNDDCLILWHANNTATDLVIWHGTNGANIQLGWVPRMLTNVSVDSVDIVHNLMGWADDKGGKGKRLRLVQFY